MAVEDGNIIFTDENRILSTNLKKMAGGFMLELVKFEIEEENQMDSQNKEVKKSGGKYVVEIIILLLALVALGTGVYYGFIKSRGYVKSKGTIISVRAVERVDNEHHTYTHYYPTVKYTVDGKEYTGALDLEGPNAIGAEIDIQYDPADPSKVHSYSPKTVILCFVVGGLMLLLAIILFVRVAHKQESEE